MKVIKVFLIVILLSFIGYFVWEAQTLNSQSCGNGTFAGNMAQSANTYGYSVYWDVFVLKNYEHICILNKSNSVTLQEVNNLGYTFYLGEIEHSNTTNLTDDLKNQITKIVSNAHFPKNVLINTPIVVVNNVALSSYKYITIPNGMARYGLKGINVPQLGADFLSEGGFYGVVTGANNLAFINLNKSILSQNLLTDVLTHELGHAIGNTLTTQDWKKYYQLRNIPAGIALEGTNWYSSPAEDFAEVYKNIYTGLKVRTSYGTTVSQATKNFIASAIDRLNK